MLCTLIFEIYLHCMKNYYGLFFTHVKKIVQISKSKGFFLAIDYILLDMIQGFQFF